jgi:hypothetical protein
MAQGRDQPGICPAGRDLRYRRHPTKPPIRRLNRIFAGIQTCFFELMVAMDSGYACPSTLLWASPGSIAIQRDIRCFFHKDILYNMPDRFFARGEAS